MPQLAGLSFFNAELSPKTYWLVLRSQMVGEDGDLCRTLHCHLQNDSCIKMGSDESHFNVSLIMSDKVATRCPQTTIFLKRRDSRSGFEPRPFCLPVLLLGHSGSRFISVVPHICIYTTEVLFLPPPPSNMSSSGAAMLFRSLQMNSRKMLGS